MFFKYQKSVRNFLTKNYFSKVTLCGAEKEKKLWDTIKPFLTCKGFKQNKNISIKTDNKAVTDPYPLVNEFNEYYINIVRNTTEIFGENFPGHGFETQIHIHTQIRINTIFTLATKHLMIIKKDNLYLHLKTF